MHDDGTFSENLVVLEAQTFRPSEWSEYLALLECLLRCPDTCEVTGAGVHKMDRRLG